MNATNYAIQIIPDLAIDDKYAAIIDAALKRMQSFTDKALRDNRIGELFMLERSRINQEQAARILRAGGRLVVGFQFETRPEAWDSNFGVFVRMALAAGKSFKFYLTPAVHEIMLQMISLEDRRTVAIFSMLNSSLDVGYRILTNLYGSQLRRLLEKAPLFLKTVMEDKLERLRVARSPEQGDLWNENVAKPAALQTSQGRSRPGSQDNILQVMADETTLAEINQYVDNVVSRSARIREKWRKIEENPDLSRAEIYELMIREDLDQLENCYAGMHIYLRAFYKNKDKRNSNRNRILRQFFAGEIERMTGDTGLLEDLLSLNREEYFKNIDRHKEL